MSSNGSMAYRPDVDGLRAVAVTSVVAYHAAPSLVPGGYVGVDVFFVISGFLISSIIVRERDEERFSLAGFYARRIKRLFPALMVVLAATWVAGWYFLLPHEFRALGKHMTAGAAYFINFTLKGESGYFDTVAGEKPLLHLWSLAVEEQFYIVWPLLLLLIRPRGSLLAALVLITVASFASNLIAAGKNPAAAFYLPQNRFWQLSSGALLALAVPLGADGHRHSFWQRLQGAGISAKTLSNVASCVGLALILGAAFGFDDRLAYPGGWAVMPTLGAVLLIAAKSDAVVNRHLLSRALMVFVGLTSYSLYLWHWPLLSFRTILGFHDDWRVTLAAVAIAVVLACATYLFVERPTRRAQPIALPVALMGMSLSLCVVGFLSLKSLLFPRLNGFDHIQVGDAIADWKFPKGLTPERTPSGIRIHRSGGGDDGVLYFGDSNIQQYWSRIGRLLSEGKTVKPVIFATTGGCPPIPGVRSKDHPNCIDFAEKVTALAGADDIKTVVIGAAWTEYFTDHRYYLEGAGGGRLRVGSVPGDKAFAALAWVIGDLIAKGKTVWLVLNIPSGGELIPTRGLHRSLLGETSLRPLELDRAKFENTWGPIRTKLIEVAKSSGARIIDPLDRLCGRTVCPGRTAEGAPMYKDGTHLRSSYVRDHATFMDVTLGVETGSSAR